MGGVKNLIKRLDVYFCFSGCLTITGAGLQDLVSACPSLNDEYFYYCDNINGPHADTASGCQNLQCGFRACCRSGECPLTSDLCLLHLAEQAFFHALYS